MQLPSQNSHHASDKSACLQDKIHFIDLVPVDSCESWYACLQGKLYLIDLVLVDGCESWYLEIAAAQRNLRDNMTFSMHMLMSPHLQPLKSKMALQINH